MISVVLFAVRARVVLAARKQKRSEDVLIEAVKNDIGMGVDGYQARIEAA